MMYQMEINHQRFPVRIICQDRLNKLISFIPPELSWEIIDEKNDADVTSTGEISSSKKGPHSRGGQRA
jgi:hypothetical protein